MSEKDKRRKKQLKRMTKIVAKVWELPQSDPFQEVNTATRKNNKNNANVFDLSTIGQKIDEGKYQLGKAGWEEFARDLGGVYNRHTHRKTKHSKNATKHIEEVIKLLGKDQTLADLAKDYIPPGDFVEEASNHHHSKKHSKASSGGGTSTTATTDHKNNTSHSSSKKRKSMTKSESLLEQAAMGKLDLSLGERQDKALLALGTFVEEKGGSKDQISSFRAIVKRSNKKTSSTRTMHKEMYDITFVNDGGRKFRTMTQIAEFLDLIRKQPPKRMKTGHNSRHRGGAASKEVQNEKKKLRQQLDKLRKQHQNATKKLDDFLNEEKESRYPIDDLRLLESDFHQQKHQHEKEQSELDYNPALLRSLQCKTYRGTKCAATRKYDMDTFPGIEPYCIPDVIMVWDFLCTFQKSLGLVPLPLDDFVNALCYSPPEQVQGDDTSSPPVYLAESHIGLLKLLFQDRSSDDWWWSVLETDETENPNFLKEGTVGLGDDDENDHDDDDAIRDDNEDSSNVGPVIKIDIAALLAEPEEPLITTSWVQALEGIRTYRTRKQQQKGKNKKQRNNKEETEDDQQIITTKSAFKDAIKTSKALVANKWVSAYLRKVLSLIKIDVMSAKKAVIWLIDLIQDARPDLWDSSVRQEAVFEKRAKLVEEVGLQMEKLDNAVATVKDEDVLSDDEDDDDDDDSDDDDDDENDDDVDNNNDNEKDESERPSTVIPPRPPPTLVDLMLPPAKPYHNAEFLNPHTWPHMAGATAHRVLHRLKRLRNELDDQLRGSRQLPVLTVAQRRQREALTASRVLSECATDVTEDEDETAVAEEDGNKKKKINPCVKAIEHLCAGGNYLELSALERLCILRLLIEAAYDTDRVYQAVDGNFTERIRAMKALNNEQRKAKKEAKDKMLNDEAAAKEQLAMEARNKFLDEKRAEIRGGSNEGSNEYTEEFVESLTDEDIIEFDEDIKADYDALPGPDSFNKNEVSKMVVRMQEEAALETHTLRVLQMEQVIERDKAELEEMEAQLHALGGEEALADQTIDRETSRSIERLQRDIDKTHQLAMTLPAEREAAMEALRDAIADGTIKVLKSAFRQAKAAKLTGPDIETGGVWALDLLRDAAVELENAKQHKRVADAQKELVAKRNKCFIRNEPLGLDRFRNRFWHFDNDEHGHVWVEGKILLRDKEMSSSKYSHIPDTPPSGYLDLTTENIKSITVGGEDMEEDLEDSEEFRLFSRREYHPSGLTATLVKYKWGCQATEESLRAMIRNLDGRGIRENELKTNVKEALEERVGMGDNKNDHLNNTTNQNSTHISNGDIGKEDNGEEEAKGDKIQTSGDEEVFQAAMDAQNDATQRDGIIIMDLINGLSSGMGQRVRVRHVVDDSKDPAVARYEEGKITGWKIRQDKVEVKHSTDSMMDDDEEEAELEDEDREPTIKIIDVPLWQALTNRGHVYWLTGTELLESLCRFSRWSSRDKSYFEYDSAFLSYRNSTGRPYCGRAPDAGFASSPTNFARSMVKREQELYTKLKSRAYEDNWGGRSGARAKWTTSMRDYTFDFLSAKEGLLTLENAFFELTGGVDSEETPNGLEILETPSTRDDIELESLDKEIQGLWNTPESRAVFHEIIGSSTTTGFLSLGLDLLCRNALAYIAANKLLNARNETSLSTRSTRRMNAWQQANNSYY